jgi:hypothetical protein
VVEIDLYERREAAWLQIATAQFETVPFRGDEIRTPDGDRYLIASVVYPGDEARARLLVEKIPAPNRISH